MGKVVNKYCTRCLQTTKHEVKETISCMRCGLATYPHRKGEQAPQRDHNAHPYKE